MSAQATTLQGPPVELGVGASAIVLLLGVVSYGVADLGQRPLRTSLHGEFGPVSAATIREVATPHLQRGFFLLDGDALEADLEALPWIRRADVERLWPDRVAIRLAAHHALARWGEGQVLSRDGLLLPPPTAGEMPAVRVSGPAERATAIASELGAALAATAEAGWRIDRWEVGADGDTRAALVLEDGGRHIEAALGREALSLHLDTLLNTALPVLMPRIGEVAGIDLRYRNGFAVRWAGAGGETRK